MNVWCFSGNLGKDAEVRYTNSGTAVLNFSVGVDVGWGDNKKTVWVAVWRFYKDSDAAENLCLRLKKGLRLWVNGEYQPKIYKPDGSEHANVYPGCQFHSIDFNLPKSQTAPPKQPQQPQAPGEPEIDFSDDIPF